MTVRLSRVGQLGLLAVLLVALAGGGCGSKEPPRAPVVKKAVPKEAVKTAEAARGPAPALVAQRSAPLYNTTGKRDPFVPFIKVEKKKALPGLETLPPLQRYELGELRFVGVIWGPRMARALVEDGAGKGYTVTVGTKIGRNGGVVSRITENELVVREQFRDYTGAKVSHVSSLKLHTGGEQ